MMPSNVVLLATLVCQRCGQSEWGPPTGSSGAYTCRRCGVAHLARDGILYVDSAKSDETRREIASIPATEDDPLLRQRAPLRRRVRLRHIANRPTHPDRPAARCRGRRHVVDRPPCRSRILLRRARHHGSSAARSRVSAGSPAVRTGQRRHARADAGLPRSRC